MPIIFIASTVFLLGIGILLWHKVSLGLILDYRDDLIAAFQDQWKLCA